MMDLEASIIQRLKELREWQIEQQKRLLEQQEIQREKLSYEQDCMYKALTLSIQDLSLNNDMPNVYNLQKEEATPNKIVLGHKQNTRHEYDTQNEKESLEIRELSESHNKVLEYSDDTEQPNNIISNEREMKHNINLIDDNQITNSNENDDIVTRKKQNISEFLMEGIEPLSSKNLKRWTCIDDIPIQSAKQDFETLLQERLKVSEYKTVGTESSTSSKNKPKRPFLKKGQGLLRFKMNQNPGMPLKTLKKHSTSMSNNPRPKYKNSTNYTLVKEKNMIKSSESVCSKENVPLNKKKVNCKSEFVSSNTQSSINQMKSTIELNVSDLDSKSEKELEEVRIFELLEEKAENSSFCSTSSAVVAFLQQSTPFKIKRKLMESSVSDIHKKNIIAVASKNKQVLRETNGLNTTQLHKFLTENIDSYWDATISKEKEASAYPSESDIKRLQNNIQHLQDQKCYETNDNEADVNLHVRFAEYNEYKTIGLTDTSSISNESLVEKNYADEDVWTDYSISASECSDVEMFLKNKDLKLTEAVDIKQQIHRNKLIQCNVREDADTELEDSTLLYTEENIFSAKRNLCKNEFRKKVETELDSLDQTSDEEQYVLSDQCNKDLSTRRNENNIVKFIEKNSVVQTGDENEMIFKSELLKSRLLELEQEIDIFRKENAGLALQRQKLQEDHKRLQKEFTEKEYNMREYKKKTEERLQEERKKIAREKALLENRLRDSQEKAQQSKVERQEVQGIKQELEKLKNEINLKESRWNAAQSRQRSQLRILRVENSKLKQEIERLQNIKNNTSKIKKARVNSNVKAIHRIGKLLAEEGKQSLIKHDPLSNDDDHDDDDNNDNLIEPMIEAMNEEYSKYAEYKISENVEDNISREHNNSPIIHEKPLQSQQSVNLENVIKKRNLYQNLLKDATVGLADPKSTTNEFQHKIENQTTIGKVKNNTESVYFNLNKDVGNKINDSSNCGRTTTDVSTKHKETEANLKLVSAPLEKRSLCSQINDNYSPNQSNSKIDKDVKQIKHPDGRIEYWYPNGNVKKIFPDQGIIKMIYYNGDVRETDKDGKVKYFYASTRTWHTTMPHGLEILEFPDGQVEKRFPDGIIEVSFPDGSIRILHSDGSEKWTLPDGTIAQTFSDGEKVLVLPNGQKEIHTKDHKRREYPDGTVKLVFPDGAQETRYSNGRIRLKDKHGNLLMDLFQ